MHDREPSRVPQPQVLEHFIGQREVVEQLQCVLEAGHCGGLMPLPHMLLRGPEGAGRATLAHLVARESASPVHEIAGDMVRNFWSIADALREPGDGEVLILRDLHRLSADAQVDLARALERGEVCGVSCGLAPDFSEQPVSALTVVATALPGRRLLNVLMEQFRLVLDLRRYRRREVVCLLERAARQLGLVLPEERLCRLASQFHRCPSGLLRLLEQTAWRARATAGSSRSDAAHLVRVLELQGANLLGTQVLEQAYLRQMCQTTGAASRRDLGRTLGWPKSLQCSVEEQLKARGHLEIRGTSVHLTPRGRAYRETAGRDAAEPVQQPPRKRGARTRR